MICDRCRDYKPDTKPCYVESKYTFVCFSCAEKLLKEKFKIEEA